MNADAELQWQSCICIDDSRVMTPFMLAAFKGHKDLTLIQREANLDYVNAVSVVMYKLYHKS